MTRRWLTGRRWSRAVRADSLISSLIHPRKSASIGVYRSPLSRQKDYNGPSWTLIRNPENGSSSCPYRPSCEPFALKREGGMFRHEETGRQGILRSARLI
jgi:hypothetical protein